MCDDTTKLSKKTFKLIKERGRKYYYSERVIRRGESRLRKKGKNNEDEIILRR